MEDFSVPTDAERGALGPTISHSFGFPAAEAATWFERTGHDNLRALRDGGHLAGGLIVIPMGQHFGGRAVPMTGVAGVAVAPEQRGRGAGTRMMRALVRELHDRGVPLSTLYPATVPLYHRAGYERAGARYAVTVRPQELTHAHDPALRVVPLDAVGEGVTRDLYNRFALARDGSLDRGPYIWGRINKPYKGEVRSFGVEGPEGIEGYVSLIHRPVVGYETEVQANDLVAVTPRAVCSVLSLLGAYRSLAKGVCWFGSPADTFTLSLRDRSHDIALKDFWMLRLTHVERALSARGYNRSLRGALTLTVTDDVVPENGGSYRVEVEGGRARVTRANTPGVALDVRALAAMYSGFRRATALAADGLARGDLDALAFADLLFAGSAPSMCEGF